LDFAEYEPKQMPWAETHSALRQVPADLGAKQLASGTMVKGDYSPDRSAMTEILGRFAIDEERFGRLQLSTLLWSSYVVGMEQPGLRGIFYKLVLSYDLLEESSTAHFSYEAKVMSLTSFNVLGTSLRLFSENRLIAGGESWAFLTPQRPRASVTTLMKLLPSEPQLKGKVALVVGASRGLGAMLTAALALQGCTVVANFKSSDSDAHRLQESLADAPGKVLLVKGDAANLAWCKELKARIAHEFGQLDFLICNACPSLLALQLEANVVERINTYVSSALALVSVPMSVFLRVIEEGSGWTVVISSIAVQTAPRDWPHYVAGKSAIEGLTRVAALQYPTAHFLVVRPPRLDTDLTNDPLPHGNAMAADVAATRIVQRLQSPAKDHIEILSLSD